MVPNKDVSQAYRQMLAQWYVQYLHFVSSSGIWDLTQRHALQEESKDVAEVRSDPSTRCAICHISWSTMGTDLAVLDVLGRIRIWSMTPAVMNRFNENKSLDLDQPHELHRAVGVFWLPNADRAVRFHAVLG